uniref:Prostacyclin synthase n=1 Tax=Mastacembelus armatus TaxID=205130 RepID=A0A7N8YIV0_9TELE
MIWTVLLLVQALLFYFILTNRSRRKTDPPLDKGLVPWLGHALEFGKDAAKFLNRMKLKHGNVFTVRAAGRYVTVLLDPHSYDTIMNDSESLDFIRHAQVLMERIFTLRLSHHQMAKAKTMMTKYVLICLVSRLCFHFHFMAGYLTLFGEQNNNTTDLSSIYEEYKKFDDLLTKMARGTLKSEEGKTAQSVRQKLWEFLAPAGLTADLGSRSWLHAYRRLLQEEGVDEETQAKAVLLQLWATQGNVGPAAFWLLGYLLTNPQALWAVKKELSWTSQVEASGTPLMDRPATTPVFDSALEETLRLTAAPFITREVVQEKTLHMADGQEYLLRKGDRVCLFPFISPQMDPEIYQEPQKFKYDRFMNKDGSVKKDFYKGGRRLKYYTMPWGAGTNGCVGKQFAINTIRQFVYMVLTNYDLELCDPNAQMPEVNASRYGFGMLQPQGDLSVRYKPRNTH